MKICNTCNIEQPLTEYYKARINAAKKQTYHNKCKSCKRKDKGSTKRISLSNRIEKLCKGCNKMLPVSQFRKTSFNINTNTQYYNGKCTICQSDYNFNKDLKRLMEILHSQNREYKCESCGYDNNFAVLCFHHITEEKNFMISDGVRSPNLYEDLDYEISICKVLCSNCHMEEHHPTRTKALLKIS